MIDSVLLVDINRLDEAEIQELQMDIERLEDKKVWMEEFRRSQIK